MKWPYPISLTLIIPVCKMRSEHWQQRLALFKEEQSTSPINSIVFLGDSITEEFQLSKYFPGQPVINRGISGDTIDGVIGRLDISVIQLKPAKLFLMIGVNDIGSDMDSNYIQAKYTGLLSLIQTSLPQTELNIQSILPCAAEWGKPKINLIKEINLFVENMCQKQNLLFIKLYGAFIDSDGYLKKNMTPDGLHLNKNGYDLWAKMLIKYIQPEINND
jgi:lysophospholipase L1-like esterase